MQCSGDHMMLGFEPRVAFTCKASLQFFESCPQTSVTWYSPSRIFSSSQIHPTASEKHSLTYLAFLTHCYRQDEGLFSLPPLSPQGKYFLWVSVSSRLFLTSPNLIGFLHSCSQWNHQCGMWLTGPRMRSSEKDNCDRTRYLRDAADPATDFSSCLC